MRWNFTCDSVLERLFWWTYYSSVYLYKLKISIYCVKSLVVPCNNISTDAFVSQVSWPPTISESSVDYTSKYSNSKIWLFECTDTVLAGLVEILNGSQIANQTKAWPIKQKPNGLIHVCLVKLFWIERAGAGVKLLKHDVSPTLCPTLWRAARAT